MEKYEENLSLLRIQTSVENVGRKKKKNSFQQEESEESDAENVFDSKLTRANYFYYLKVLVILGKGSWNFLR